MAINVKTHTSFMCQHGTHPFVESVHDVTGVLATDLVLWLVHGVEYNVLRFLTLTKCIVDKWLLYYLIYRHILMLMIMQTAELLRRCTRLQNRCIDRGKELLLPCVEILYVHAELKVRSKCK